MALVEWSELKYGVKIKDVDEQHQKLIGIFNELYMATYVGHSQDVIQEIISELQAYITYHFGLEEKLMYDNHFPGLQEHKAEHDTFVRRVDEFYEKYESGQKDLTVETLIVETLTFFRDVDYHIKGTDKEYSGYLNSKGVR